MFRAGAGTGGLGLGVGVAVLLTLQWALHCTAQTYPYTSSSPADITQPYVRTYLYSPEFTVFGNVKTIGVAAQGNDPTPASVPTIKVYEASYSFPTIHPSNANTYSEAATLIGKNIDGVTDATTLGYAIEGGQSVKTSDVIVATTISDTSGVGAAYVFKQYSFASWSQAARLQPTDLDGSSDKFGASAAMDEFDPTRIMIGAPYAGDIDGGAVYFYESSPSAKYWTQGQKLLPNVESVGGRFGDKVEMFGRYAAITEPGTCKVYIYEQERPKPKAPPKVSCGTSPTPSPVTSTWQPLVQHETLRWSQQQILFNDDGMDDFECNVGGRSLTYGDGDTSTFNTSPSKVHDPQYSFGSTAGYGGYFSISMFDDTLAVGVPGFEDSRVREDYHDDDPSPELCFVICNYNPGPDAPLPLTFKYAENEFCCPDAGPACSPAPNPAPIPDQPGGPLYLGQCPGYRYAPGDNGRVYIFDMETFKGDCDQENYFPTALSFDELVNLRDSSSHEDDDDDCHEHHHVHKPKPKPQCEVSRWSSQQILTSPSNNSPEFENRNADCQNFGYKVDVYKDVVTVNEVNTLNFDITPGSHMPFASSPTELYDAYHCMSNLYYPLYDEDVSEATDQALVKEGFVYAYKETSSNTWTHIGGTAPYYEVKNTNPTPSANNAANTQVVGTDLFTMESRASGFEVDVQTTDTTWQCMVVTLMDQFGDGWGGAKLQITDSDGRKQTFAPYCDSPGTSTPFVYDFRWCPDDWEHGNEVKLEILHSPSTKFRWELEWSVYFEWNQQVVYGDWETKMTLSYESIGSEVLRLKHAEHLINTTAACSQCDLWTAAPTGAPSSKPIRPKPKPKPPTKSPTPHSLSISLKSVDESVRVGDESTDVVGSKEELSESVLEGSSNTEDGSSYPQLRHLRHKTKASVRTHSPTISPAPTLSQTPFSTWEQISLTGSVAIDGRAGWDRPYTTSSYVTANIPMKYFISDKDGKHLFYEGTKCGAEEPTVCWNDLPPGDRDYILRVGGAATFFPAPAPSGWSMCGRTGGKMEQLDFRIKDYIDSNLNEAECDGLLHSTRASYCQQTLDLIVPVSGIVVLEGLTMDTFSKVDLDLLGHALSLIFSPSTMLEVSFSQHMHSSRGAHVGFSIDVPSSVYSLDPTSFDALNITAVNSKRLLQRTDLSSTLDTLLLDYSALNVESNLNRHGKVYIEDIVVSLEAKTAYVRSPYYYIDDDAEAADVTVEMSAAGDEPSSLYQIFSTVQDHMVMFVVFVIGAAVLYVRYRSQEEDCDEFDSHVLRNYGVKKKKSSSSEKLSDEKGKRSENKRRRHQRSHSAKKREEGYRDNVSVSSAATEVLAEKTVPTNVIGSNSGSNRFVPYNRSSDDRDQSTAMGTGTVDNCSGDKTVDIIEDDGDFSDELDHILSHFESSSSSSDSDEWEQT